MKNKPIGTLDVTDVNKTYKIPFYHEPGYCDCMTCKLARKEISLDIYKGYFLGKYITEMYAADGENKDIDNSIVSLFFTEDELIDFIWNN